jgi:signal transduction histidine kinase
MLYVGSPTNLPKDHLALIGELGRAFSVAYARYLDFQQLEAQNKNLDESNRAMSSANKELYELNRKLQQEGALERIRGQLQAMEQASDFDEVLSILAEDLKSVGLVFETCGIDVLDEPVHDVSMGYFEDHGYRYTTYTIDPEGGLVHKSFRLAAPFPDVIEETIARFIAGEPWQGRSGDTMIVEVPAAGYGRLRLTASNREDFTEEEVDTLRDFAGAMALGYARYLDFREIQEQTERKSQFMANMSHELRTPMNAIIGFTRMVLRRSGDVLPERQVSNLEKVQQSADHLMSLINDILDLSKIEAGRMDVETKRFGLEKLIAGACATVTPMVKSGVRLHYELGENVNELETDEGRLRQIVINLLSNAAKFTDKGEVFVKASALPPGMLSISVKDTGAGIPADALDLIFEEFRQVEGSDTDRKGTGLGLSITKKFAELLGGTIGVDSEVGKGSVFSVKIPTRYES